MYAYNFGSVTSARFGILDRALVRRVRLHRRDHDGVGGRVRRADRDRGPVLALHRVGLLEQRTLSGNWLLLFGGIILIVNLIMFPEGVAGNEYKKKQLRKRAGKQTLGEQLAARYFRRQPETSKS